jgi:thiol-disulfide isomerase/thioredoxin
MVVHFWGPTCGPCRIEMPAWGKLLTERSDLNLVVINADLVLNEPDAVSTMLAQMGLGAAENWTFNDDFVERLRYEIDPQWRGEIPRTMLIARDGSTTVVEGVTDMEVSEHGSQWRSATALGARGSAPGQCLFESVDIICTREHPEHCRRNLR